MKKTHILSAFSLVMATMLSGIAQAAPTDAELFAMWTQKDVSKWVTHEWDCMRNAWSGMTYAMGAIWGYGYSGDMTLLDRAATGLDLLKATVRTDPRGEMAFITGDTDFYNTASSVQGVAVAGESFKMISGFAMFAAFVNNEPAASAALKQKATEYVAFVDSLMVKWNRDWWYENDNYSRIHPNAGVYRYPTYPELDPNPAYKCHTAQYNKHHDAGRVNLYMWQATGDSIYYHRARKVLIHYISNCRLKDSGGTYYEWDYGNPAGPYDGACEDKSWIEHMGGYSRLTTDYVVECYEAGIAIDSKEINRFVKTILLNMWNGNVDAPVFGLNDGNNFSTSWSALSAFGGFHDDFYDAVKNQAAGLSAFHQSETIPRVLYFRKIMEEGNYLPDDQIRDYIAPKFLYCRAINRGKFEIGFDEPMDQASCENSANWSLSRNLPVVGVVMSDNNTKATVYTDEQTTGITYNVTVAATDAAGNKFFTNTKSRPSVEANSVPLDHDGLAITDVFSGLSAGGVLLPNPVSLQELKALLPDARLCDMSGNKITIDRPGMYLLQVGNELVKKIMIVE